MTKVWKQRIQNAIDDENKWRKNFKVEIARAYFEGMQKPEWARDSEWITVNKVYSHLKSQLPNLYSIDPYFYVKLNRTFNPDPETMAQWETKGKVRQAFLNYMKVELDLKSKARLAIQDAHFAFGVVKVFYSSNLTENEKAGQPYMSDNGEPETDEMGQPLLQPDYLSNDGNYSISRVHPDNFIFGNDSGSLECEWNWVAEKIKMPLYKCRQDPRYSKKAIRRLSEKLATRFKGEDVDIDDQIIEFWEVWDIDRKKFQAISLQIDEPIIKEKDIPKGIDRHPYAILRFTLRDNSPYPIPPMSQGIDPQREYNDLRSKILTHRKRFNRKYEVNVGLLEDADFELQKLETGEDGTVIRKMGSDQAIRAIQDAPLDQQSYTELALLNQDMVELLGANDSARGVASADSATEADIIDKRLEIKEGDKQSIVVEWLNVIAKKLDYLVQTYIDRDMAVKIMGPEGEQWVQVREEDYEQIEGDYEYSIHIGSTQPRLPQIERAQWIAFMSQVVIPMPAIMTKPQLMKKIASMFGIEDESMLNEMRELGQQVIQQEGAGVNQQGSQAGVPEENPVGAVAGMVNGLLGGNVNGGGAPGGMS